MNTKSNSLAGIGCPAATCSASFSTVRVIENPWKWWFTVGEEYQVRPYAYQATSGAHNTYCYCGDCCRERAGKTLYDCWEVVGGKHAGSIIPQIHAEIIEPNV
jgi:hypothetical protein